MGKQNGLLGLRLWYLLYFGADNVMLYLPLLFSRTMHFSAPHIGALMAMRRGLRLFGAPFYSYVLDRTRAHRTVIPICLVAYYSLSVTLAFMRSLPLVAITMFLRECCNAGIDSAINAAAMGALEEENEQRKVNGAPLATYGQLRLYGSLGWGLMSFTLGAMLDKVFGGDMRVILFAQACLGVIAIFILINFVDLSPALFANAATRRAGMSSNATPADDTDWFLSVIMFIANVLLLNFAFGVMATTEFLYMGSLHVPNTVLGLATLINCGVEAACFHYHGQLSTLFHGDRWAFRLAVVANAAVLLIMANVHRANDPAVPFLMLQVLVGFVFSMYWASAVHLAAELAPPGRETSAQGMLSALGWGLGCSLGDVTGGVGLHTVGAPAMYTWVALIQMWVLLAPLALFYFVNKLKNRRVEYYDIDDRL